MKDVFLFSIKMYFSEILGKFYESHEMLFWTSLDTVGKSDPEFHFFSLNI